MRANRPLDVLAPTFFTRHVQVALRSLFCQVYYCPSLSARTRPILLPKVENEKGYPSVRPFVNAARLLPRRENLFPRKISKKLPPQISETNRRYQKSSPGSLVCWGIMEAKGDKAKCPPLKIRSQHSENLKRPTHIDPS